MFAPNEITDTINADHLNMVRFLGREDRGYQQSLSAIRRILRQIQDSGSTSAGTVQAHASQNRPGVGESTRHRY